MKISDIREFILKRIKKQGRITSGEIAALCGISRQAAHAHLRKLTTAKKTIRIGKTRGVYYVSYSKKIADQTLEKEGRYRARLTNKNLEEDAVYRRIKYNQPFINKLPANTQDILHYAFTEILNNAIEYSKSATITVLIAEASGYIYFEILDKGIGIFKHVQKKFQLKNEYEALEEILKGKKTTMPERHTGEGIFFTSKISDAFELYSSKIKLIIDNIKNDIYTEEIPFRKGTKVCFRIKGKTKKRLEELFKQYTDEGYEFQKTKVTVRLYQRDAKYISRSQARRLVLGLDKFKVIILDFNRVKTIGQGFADEIFRVFQNKHPHIKIEPVNCCDAVRFMIKRAGKRD